MQVSYTLRIPYWLFDADYKDSMVIASRVKSGKHTATHYYRVNTDCKLYYYPVDASSFPSGRN